jgi:hypothetical protein
MNDALPAAAPAARAPRCAECTSYDILWHRRFPVEFPLTNYGIGAKHICERCALYLVEQRAKMPFGPDPATVRDLIARKQAE